jgi:exosortase A
MKRDAEFIAGDLPTRAAWRYAPVLAASLCVLGILVLHWQTAASVVAIWWRSETFAHGFIVVPICLWLTWRNRDTLAQIAAKPWWPGLAFVFLAGALWLVMSVANVLGLKQFALAFMIQAAVITILGTRIARALVFPLVFLLFAIPAGEILVPTLIDWTADFTVNALRWSGVPVYREANHFIIPSGRWSVVEACSGIRYIIASFMVGTIYAAIAYRTTRRRVMFIAASIVVPVVANWLRAYIIVMIGHLSNNKYAIGVDHLIYGWLFFGAVMLLLFWVGSFWQEETAPAPSAARPATQFPPSSAGYSAPGRVLFAAALAATLTAGVWVPIEAAIDRPDNTATPVVSVIAGENDWTPSSKAVASWKPRYKGFASELQQTFRKDGQDVGLYIAYYRNQEKGGELITSGNLLVARDDWNWKLMAESSDSVEWTGQRVPINQAEILGNQIRFEVFRLYWVDGRTTPSQYVAKALLAWSKLSGHGDDAALIVLYTPILAPDDASRVTLRAFASAMSPAIERTLAATRSRSR